ncbi:hypothetical protein LCGC14_0388800 [marine sediment metagenome]|uniref:LamG-like jellyroll fold domain-containing protein n=1 Tax=marine sediment metagenome TaxID=412755 RepID=A0A0F9W9B5_9ZZZZ
MPGIGIGIGIHRGVLIGDNGLINNLSTLFDGVDERVDIPDDASLDFERTDPFSVSHWVQYTAVAGLQITSSKRSVALTEGWATHSSNGLLIFLFAANGGTESIQIRSTNSITDTNWHNLIFTYDGSSTAAGANIYIDGVQETRVVITDTLASSILNNNSFKLAVDGNNTFPFNGNQDENSVWKKELSTSEATELYNGGKPTNLLTHSAASDLVGWWRMGDDDTFPTLTDNSTNTNNGTVINGLPGDFVNDTP